MYIENAVYKYHYGAAGQSEKEMDYEDEEEVDDNQ